METQHTETIVEKAVAYVKDVFGITPDDPTPDVTNPEYKDTAPEVTAENAMRLDPNVYTANSAGQIDTGGYITPMEETDAARLLRHVDEHPRVKTATELNAESARAEDGD